LKGLTKMKLLKLSLAVVGLIAFSATSQAQFTALTVPTQTITVPTGVAGGASSNATSTAKVGFRGFAFIATTVGTNAATTGNISYAWRASSDGSSTNTGIALWTNVVAATGTSTNRFYGVVPATAINGGYVHLSIINGNDATNRVINVGSVTVIAF
jgi:hypothetical protein